MDSSSSSLSDVEVPEVVAEVVPEGVPEVVLESGESSEVSGESSVVSGGDSGESSEAKVRDVPGGVVPTGTSG